jgi:5'-methylthioadenosine phosphorylase
MFGIIGGSGLAGMKNLERTRREVVRTPYGEASGTISLGLMNGHEVAFLPRHGYGHILAPHEINYRANIWALRQVGVNAIFSVSSAGSLDETYAPGSLAVIDQIIDYTYGRKHTYFEGVEQPVVHIDFSEPFDAPLRQRLIDGAAQAQVPVLTDGTFACTQGPRLETRAELRRFKQDGAHMVGMTLMPEAALARELELPYAALVIVAAFAGRSEWRLLSLENARAALEPTFENLGKVLTAALV